MGDLVRKESYTRRGRRYCKGGQIYAQYVWNLHNPNDPILKNGGDEIHHIDEDKLNDAIDNLVKMTKAEHTRLHAKTRRHTEESKKKISASLMGHVSAMKGKKHTEQTKKLMSKKRKGIVFTDEHKQKLKISRNKRDTSGVNHPLAKLDWNAVYDIRKNYVYAYGGRYTEKMAIKYGVSRAHISKIIANKTWIADEGS